MFFPQQFTHTSCVLNITGTFLFLMPLLILPGEGKRKELIVIKSSMLDALQTV